ncbi:MAG: hypothetical protein ABIF87_10765 [Pseudomonadota bacterium]
MIRYITMRRICRSIVVSLFICFCFFTAVSSAESPSAQEQPRETEKIASLQAILDSVARMDMEIGKKQDALEKSRSKAERDEVLAEIDDLKERIKTLKASFAEIAAGVDIKILFEPPTREFNLSTELKDILKPLLDELRRMTERPREIDRLRREIAVATDRLSVVKNTRSNVVRLADTITDQRLKYALNELEQSWTVQQQQIETQQTVANEQLKQKLGEKRTFSETAQELFRLFFKSRGRNLLLSLAAFIAVWFILTKLHGRVKRISPLHKKERTLSARAFDLSYEVIAFLLAVSALLVVLYTVGDWVLLTIAAIIIFGIVWASKSALPRFWEQAKLLLNLGAVREEERVVYNGLPWKVESIGFYSHLVNKELLGGDVRLPLRKLLDLHSRPWKDKEPWFPTREGNWVLLSDDTYGKVIVQTPEVVELVLRGGGRKVYRAADFLSLNPTNLSAGFRINVVFGIDYQHQSIVTEEVPAKMEQMLRERLTEDGYGEYIIRIKVEFRQAGASSLDLEVLADFSGEVQDKYYILQRAIQRICVDACNKHGWVIPFTQLTVHMAAAKGD